MGQEAAVMYSIAIFAALCYTAPQNMRSAEQHVCDYALDVDEDQ